MSIPLINAPHLTAAEGAAIRAKLQEAYDLMTPKGVSITAEERRKYGRINEKNKLKANMVREYRQSQPALSAPGADYNELDKGHTTRMAWTDIRSLLKGMLDFADGTEILHDNNAMNIVGKDYRHTRNQAQEGVAGYEAKYASMKPLWDTSGSDANEAADEEAES